MKHIDTFRFDDAYNSGVSESSLPYMVQATHLFVTWCITWCITWCECDASLPYSDPNSSQQTRQCIVGELPRVSVGGGMRGMEWPTVGELPRVRIRVRAMLVGAPVMASPPFPERHACCDPQGAQMTQIRVSFRLRLVSVSVPGRQVPASRIGSSRSQAD